MLKFSTLMRDWLGENFPQYKAGHAYEIIGIFVPDAYEAWKWGGGRWVASMRLEGTKLFMWHGPSEKMAMYHLDITDSEIFVKIKTILTQAEPREVIMWMWEPIV